MQLYYHQYHSHMNYILPNTKTIICIPSSTISLTITNFLAESLLKNFFSQNNLPLPSYIGLYTAIDAPTLYKYDPIHFNQQSVQLPCVFSCKNTNNINIKLPNIFEETNYNDKIQQLPATVPLEGFPAAVLTYSNILQIPCFCGIIITTNDTLTSSWVGFERITTLYLPNKPLPSVYDGHGERSVKTQKIVFEKLCLLYKKLLIKQNKILPKTLPGNVCRLHRDIGGELYA